MTAHLPVTLPNVDEIEAGFNRSFDLYVKAFEKIAEADAAIKAAYAAIEAVTPGASFHDQSDARELAAFNKAVRLPAREIYLGAARRLINTRCWEYVVDRCGLGQLMDTQAKKELDAALRYVPMKTDRRGELITEEESGKGPPPFSAESARATIEKFAGDAGTIWRRGIANCFSALDRRFRSHDGFKVGSRIILDRLANDWGSVEYHGTRANHFRDIERTFQILDGRDPRHSRSDFLFQVDRERRDMPRERYSMATFQSEHDGPYFKVRVYKNGNAHLWFTRDDLVELVNKTLAEYYGEVIGDGRTTDEDIFAKRKTTPAKSFGFYPTPAALAAKIANRVPYSEKPYLILEPSAGTGNLASALLKPREITHCGKLVGNIRHKVDCVEVQEPLAAALRESRKFNRVAAGDFLRMPPTPIYDGVVMNPPFDLERDIDHVTWALRFLKPEGFLLAIMSAGTEFRETKKAGAFRKLLAERKGWMVDLPPASFAEVGTYVNTVLVGINAGSKPWRLED